MSDPLELATKLRGRAYAFRKLYGNLLYYGEWDAEIDCEAADFIERHLQAVKDAKDVKEPLHEPDGDNYADQAEWNARRD